MFTRRGVLPIDSFVLFTTLLMYSLTVHSQNNSEYRLSDPVNDTFIGNGNFDEDRFGEGFYCCDISDVHVDFNDSNMNISITVLPDFNESTYVFIPLDLNNATSGLVNNFWPEQTLMDLDASIESDHGPDGFRFIFHYLASGERGSGLELEYEVFPEKVVVSVPTSLFGNTDIILARFMVGIDVPNTAGVIGVRDNVPDVRLQLSGGGSIWATRTLPPLEIALPEQTTGCIDTDGDGWGWDGRQSCQIVTGECIDSDGDGWGWNGIATCAPTSRECVDTDGDGWGWNGFQTCQPLVETTLQDDSVYDVLPCIDTDGDGWGWKEPPGRPDLGRSCVAT